jgi:hypothetical protein
MAGLVTIVPAAAQQSAEDVATVKSLRTFVAITEMAGKPKSGTDRMIYLNFDDETREMVITGFALVQSKDPSLAIGNAPMIVRLRYNMKSKAMEPLDDDADFAGETDARYFVFHAKKDRMWEVDRIDGETLYRPCDETGACGEWMEFAKG